MHAGHGLPPAHVPPHRNETLIRAWTALAASIQMSIVAAGLDRAVQNMDVPRHLDIVEAIASGNPDAARAAVVEHMDRAVHVLVG